MGNSMGFLKKLKIKPPCDPAVPLLSIYTKKPPKYSGKRYTHSCVLCGMCRVPMNLLLLLPLSSVTKLCPALCDPVDWSLPGSSLRHCLPEFAQTHVHWMHEQSNGWENVIDKYNAHIQRNTSRKEEWHLATCDNTGGLREYHAKWNKSDRKKQMMYDFTYMWDLKHKTSEQIQLDRNRIKCRINRWLPKGRHIGGGK